MKVYFKKRTREYLAINIYFSSINPYNFPAITFSPSTRICQDFEITLNRGWASPVNEKH